MKNLLRRLKYIGWWPWGKTTTCRDPNTGEKWQEERPPEDAEKWLRHRPHLQIVPDEFFAEAQSMLDALEEKYAGVRNEDGKFKDNRGANGQPRHLLQELIVCGECGSCFQVRGKFSKYLGCGGYRANRCTCYTMIRRDVAERLISAAVSQAVLEDPHWVQEIVDQVTADWRRRADTEPNRRKGLEAAIGQAEQRISRLVDQLENGGADSDISTRLHNRRNERDELKRELAVLGREAVREPPTVARINEKLAKLRDVLATDTSAGNRALRALLGQVTVSIAEAPGRKRKFLRGAFTITVSNVAETIGLGEVPADDGAIERKITVDFMEPPPWADLANRIKDMVDAGAKDREIAAQLDCPRCWVGRALNWWYGSRGLSARTDARGEMILAGRPSLKTISAVRKTKVGY